MAEQKNEREVARRAQMRVHLADNPFDPRTEVSADAKRIILHMWTIFVLLPVALGVIYMIVK